jgi:hypothetical protein
MEQSTRICVIMIIICVTDDENEVHRHAILYVGPRQIRTRGFKFCPDHNFNPYCILEIYLQLVSRFNLLFRLEKLGMW